jgi:PAS domain S-box-containing protein
MHPDPGVELLIRAGIVLATSLHDPQTTMREVAALTVPKLGDICVIDLLDRDNRITDVAVAAADPELERGLEELRMRFPVSLEGSHPVAGTIRSGQPVLLEQMDGETLSSFAESDAHARFMIEHGYRSAVVAPLVARDRTLGAISVLRFGQREPYRREDLDLVRALAWRAALAIDNARLFSELRGLEQRLEAILTNLAEAITVEDREGRTVFANAAAVALLGLSSAEELTDSPPGTIMPRFVVTDEHGRELGLEDMPGRRLLAGERTEPLLVRNVVRATGEERWLRVRSSPVLDPDSGELAYAVNVLENVTDIKRAQLTGDFLAEASRVLASSMDCNLTLKRIARLAVPQIADWCAIDLLDEHGQVERVAMEGSDPGPREPGQSAGLEGSDPGPRVPGEGAAIEVPMVAATKTVGTIVLAMGRSGRHLDERDVRLAEELGRRAGVAVENARLYTERMRIARTLQHALLPESLPRIPGVELQALYTAAGELNEVGGDFYDVFAYDERRYLLAIGDVCGKGPRAAGITALARYSLRAAAFSGQGPEQMLGTLHRTLTRQPGAADLCTVCLVMLTPREGGAHATITLAGHPPPLLLRSSGEAEQVGEIGSLLGMIEPVALRESEEIELGEGDTLLLYTDGVTDAGTHGTTLGEDGLVRVCSQQRDESGLGTLLQRIEQAAVERSEGSLRDDLALLAARVTRLSAPLQRDAPREQLQPAP